VKLFLTSADLSR